MPPPVPPSVKAGRTIAGTGNSTSGECAMIERGVGIPTPCTVERKSSRSSALLIAFEVGADQLDAESGASSIARLSAV